MNENINEDTNVLQGKSRMMTNEIREWKSEWTLNEKEKEIPNDYMNDVPNVHVKDMTNTVFNVKKFIKK